MSRSLLTPDSIDNRREPRYPVAWPARLRIATGQEIDVKVRDLSDNGIGLRSDHPIPQRDRFELVLGVPDLLDPRRLQAVPGTMSVAFLVMSHGEWRLGGTWADLTPPARKLLDQWIQKIKYG
ncbi:PilZ domain-containing protein [Leptothrix discophora]|uniref:PilZ domain-containing protein n=1 Tax=Leptothrix discophora TaxID=89 RepID=A0ABT9G3A2_LEPDI|nr:PilZ domain-containing protein [Leptothrix discophora]MDP4300663.1 PilZ domain-containing protein [Leptothrix discophora]